MIKSMKLGTKLMLGFSVVALIALFLGISGYYGAFRSDSAIGEIGMVRLPGVKSVLEVKAAVEEIVSAQRTLLNPENDLDTRRRQYEIIDAARARYQAAGQAYGTLPHGPDEAREWSAFLEMANEWQEVNEEILSLSREFDQIDILNPTMLLAQLERFRADAFDLQVKTLQMIALAEMDADSISTASNAFSFWAEDFSTRNEGVQGIVNSLDRANRQMLESVEPVQDAIRSLNTFEAERHFREGMIPASMAFNSFINQLISEIRNAEALQRRISELTMMRGADLQARAFGHLDNLIAINEGLTETTVTESSAQGAFLRAFSLTAAIVGVILALMLGTAITRSTTRPIQRIITSLSESSRQVTDASMQVATSSQNLAEGTSEQAASLEETSSSMEEMDSMTRQNADNAGQAKAMMDEARQVLEKVNGQMRDMTAAVDEISRSSEETSKIIKTIDEIAFQTNLLALNAAVEAARAGEAGAGFAVVADEVRNLAMRAAEAAKTTSDLIETTVRSVKKGSELTGSTTEAFQENISLTEKIGQLVDEVATASQEQSKGIHQVNIALAEMDKVTQKSAASAEESASASEELSSQADSMLSVVRELADIVGGSLDQRKKEKQSRKEQSRKLSLESHGASRPLRQKTETKQSQDSGRLLEEKTGDVARKNARQVIPLDDDDSEFRDF